MRANSCYLYAGENDEAFRQEAHGRLVGCAIVFTSYGAFY